jgi:hypothetical protein
MRLNFGLSITLRLNGNLYYKKYITDYQSQ